MKRMVEIRTYILKPGTRAEFHSLVSEQSIPMLKRWQVDVVAYGESLGEGEEFQDSYYLIRSYASFADLQASQDAFYGSAEWKQGPREAILALIKTYTSLLIEVDDATLQGLRC